MGAWHNSLWWSLWAVRVEDVTTCSIVCPETVRRLLAETDQDLTRKRWLLGHVMYPRHGCAGLGTGLEAGIEALRCCGLCILRLYARVTFVSS